MLAIRMQRTGRSGHAQFRVIVQDARSHPKSGKVVEYLGSYNPHTKVAQLKAEEIASYMEKGAQPSDRVAKLLKAEGIKLPAWVKISPGKKRSIKNPAKLRRNAPPGEKLEQKAPTPAAEPIAEETPAPAEPAEAPEEAAESADSPPEAAEPAAEEAPAEAETTEASPEPEPEAAKSEEDTEAPKEA